MASPKEMSLAAEGENATSQSSLENIGHWKEIATNISNLFMWSYLSEIHSEFLGTEASFVLIADQTKKGNDIGQFDFQYISKVADHIDAYIEKSIEGIKLELAQNPDAFGIKKEQITDYLEIPNKEFPVSMPNFTFYPGKDIFLQFYEADFPKADYGFGIGVSFKEDVIVSIDVLDSDRGS